MNWQSLPFKEHPKRSIFLVIFLLALIYGIYPFGIYWVILSVTFICLSVNTYFLPTNYTMDESGITIKGILLGRNKKWAEFKSYYKDKNGVLLSPFEKHSRLEDFRGTYIRFNKNEKEVIGFITRKGLINLREKSK
jgi:uncharacterized membrane protein